MAFTSYNPENIHKARVLRKEMTREERRLWYEFLRDYPVKIYRQRPIEQYIVDFYCGKAHLVIELDGSQHFMTDGMEYDALRTELLEKFQLKVLRFSNLDVRNNFQGVCEMIDMTIRERISLP